MSQYLWSQRQDIGPSARGGHALAYDASRKRTVLFGGLGASGALSDTWEWDGSFWTQVADTGPSPRWMHALAYDGTRTILFGGATPNGENPSIVHSDTWGWDGERWTQLDDSGPSGRAAASLTPSMEGDELILFGGWSPSAFSDDTWSFSKGAWTQVADIGPSPRAWHSVGRDTTGRLVLFGGADSTVSLGDTWAWNAGAWSHIQDIGPAARAGAAAAGGLLLFGGGTGGFRNPTQVSGDTWMFDGALWSQLQDTGPSARWASAAALDVDRSRVVLFGGFTAVNTPDPGASGLADTWEAPAPPTSGPQPSGGVTVSVPGTFSLGSDCGFVQFQLAAPTTAVQQVKVTANGQPSTIASPPVTPGDQGGFALFSLDGLPAGTVTVAVTVGTATATAQVILAAGPSLGALSANPLTVPPGGSVSMVVAVAAPELVTRTAQLVFLESALPGAWTLTIPPGIAGNVAVAVTIPPATPPGGYDALVVSQEAGTIRVAGPVSITVQ